MISPLVAESAIRIRGARAHNLRDVDIDIPHGGLTVITGVSGSGKSSLAFDTLFAEGQRQYIESLSAYARQILDQLPRPDVDHVEGLQPTLCIDQHRGGVHPRSTVATITEIYDHLRLLYARVGVQHCSGCGTPIAKQSVQQIIDALLRIAAETKLVLLAPLVRGRRGAHREEFERMRARGWLRARVDGEIHPLDQLPQLAPRKLHTIEAVVDRLTCRPSNQERLIESARLALQTGGGVMTLLTSSPGQDGWEEQLLSTLSACPSCGHSFPELEPRSFSFNSPYGACPRCEGLGWLDGHLCADCQGGRLQADALAVTLDKANIVEVTALPIDEAAAWFAELPQRLHPSARPVASRIVTEVAHRLRFLEAVGLGYLSLDRPAATLSGGEHQRVRLATSLGSGLVGVCYVLDEPSIGLHPADNHRLIDSIIQLRDQGNTIVVVEHDEAMMRAADLLVDMGPGAGRDGGRIISQGTPQEVAADFGSVTGRYLADRTGAGTGGGSTQRKAAPQQRFVEITGGSTHNLQDVTARFPLDLLVGVTGVSGSGKSSLVNETLVPAVQAVLGSTPPGPVSESSGNGQLPPPTEARFRRLTGAEQIDRIIRIDQRPIGRSGRSCPATYSGVLDDIRKLFATTRHAKQLGFGPSRFSFNAAPGRCDLCKGTGIQRIEMNFLSDLELTCPRCGGRRYNRQTLAVKFKGHSIADCLRMTIDEALVLFEHLPAIVQRLSCLRDIGLGYLQLGQASTTLSGGEAQRIKLGTELSRPPRGHTLYVLDEPTTGLHFADVDRLLQTLGRLVEAGNTVIVIEHNLDVIAACDWLVDLGPGGGREGGRIVASGTPQQLAQVEASLTGRYLRGGPLEVTCRSDGP